MIEEIEVTASYSSEKARRRAEKKAARKEKRLKLAEIRTWKKIQDAEDKLQTIEQKREGYSRGGVAKAN